MANIDNVQLPDGSSYNIVDNTSGFATQNYVDSAVSSVTKTTIGLGNVDNTSDLNKPISTATQTALDTLDEDKADKTDIATVESGTTASRAYSVGELVYVSGTLYRVKTAIASGATFTAGTNVEVTNVSNSIPKFAKLWENPNPTQAFVAQTITLNSADYDLLVCVAVANINAADLIAISDISLKGYGLIMSYVTSSGTSRLRRLIRVNDTTYTAEAGNNGSNVDNASAVPVAIYGIKL